MDDIVAAQKVEQKPRKRPLLPPDFVRAMLAGHSALGLAFAALIYIVCLTGTLAVFAYELQRWEQPDVPVAGEAMTPDAIGAAVKAGYAQAVADKADHDMFLLAPGFVSPRLIVSYHDHERGTEGSWAADAEGRLVARIKAPLTEFLIHLHINLHLPRTFGMFLVGLTGVALLSSLVSGLLAHPRILKDAFALRWGGSQRLQQADLHNRLGVWGLPFHIAVSLTGALLGLSVLIVGVLALAAYDGDSGKAFATLLGPQPGKDETPAPVPDVAMMIRHVQSAQPEARVASVFVQHIGKAGQVVNLGMTTPGHLAFSNAYYFDGTGKALGDGGLETGSIGQQILGALSPLHFGWFGGLAVKLAYGVLGLALSVVTHTGVAIWLSRRRDKGRPAARWERLWPGVTWGQPLALAAAAVAALLAGEGTALVAYLAATVGALVLAAALPSSAAVARALCAVGAVVLVALVTVHGVMWARHVSDAMAWGVSGLMLVAAVALGMRARAG
jgi:uncharacterized iron-regulated membrane protein